MNDPATQLYVVIAILAASVQGDNFTTKFLSMDPRSGYQGRQQRFLSFNTVTDKEISIDMQFAVPFITIPISKSADMTKGAMANINVGSLLVAGIIVVVTGFVVPLFFKLVDSSLLPLPIYSAFSRVERSDSFQWWRILTVMDQALMQNNIDTTTCTQRAVCSLVKKSRKNVSSGKATTGEKLINEIISNEWFNKFISGTAIDSAVKNGMEGVNCAEMHKMCKLNEIVFASFIQRLTKTLNVM